MHACTSVYCCQYVCPTFGFKRHTDAYIPARPFRFCSTCVPFWMSRYFDARNPRTQVERDKTGRPSFGFFAFVFFKQTNHKPKQGLAPPPPLECNSTLPLVTAVLITPKGAQSPGSRRIGVIGALVLILPSETV